MKKSVFALLLVAVPFLASFGAEGGKAPDFSVVYAAAFFLALLLLGFVLFFRLDGWLRLLFFCISLVNLGYWLLSLSTSLSFALWANRLSYLGSVFLPLCMLLSLLRAMKISVKRPIIACLFAASFLVFLLAVSYPVLDLYYRFATLSTEGANSVLVKTYGPLHAVYFLYLVGYFAAMVFFIVRAFFRDTPVSVSHAVLLAIAVLVNLFVWLCEQIVSFEFEMLSVSYIISELFLIGAHFSAKENTHLRRAVRVSEGSLTSPPPSAEAVDDTRLELFSAGLLTLTETELAVYRAHVSRLTTKEILQTLSITENTLKYHNKNLYSKLYVSSKKELLEIYKAFGNSPPIRP